MRVHVVGLWWPEGGGGKHGVVGRIVSVWNMGRRGKDELADGVAQAGVSV